jgi:hypothetical protein
VSAGLVFVLALAGVHGIGAAVLAPLPRSCRELLPVFPATGLLGGLVLTIEMFLFSIARIPWTIPLLCAVPVALGLVAVFRRSESEKRVRRPGLSLPVLATAFVVGLVSYAAVTGRATSVDLLLFWGAKSEHFALARAIDVGFLRRPEHYLMHPDYPPLLPCLLAFATIAAGRFPWGASLLVMPWFLAMAATTYHAAARRRNADRLAAGWVTAVFAAAIGLAAVSALTAGNADVPLIAFETAALVLLVDRGSEGAARWGAGLALAAATILKIEGLFFAALATGVFVVRAPARERRNVLVSLALPSAIAIGSWLLFCRAEGLLDLYRGGQIGPFTFRYLGRVSAGLVKAASYECLYVPWIAAALAAAALRRTGFALAPLLVAAGFVVVNAYFYMHGGDPTVWIGWSAARTLISVLPCLFVSIGAIRRPVIA